MIDGKGINEEAEFGKAAISKLSPLAPVTSLIGRLIFTRYVTVVTDVTVVIGSERNESRSDYCREAFAQHSLSRRIFEQLN